MLFLKTTVHLFNEFNRVMDLKIYSLGMSVCVCVCVTI